MKLENSALVVIDLQKGVVAGIYDGDAVIDRVANLVERARLANTPVIWVQHNDEEIEIDSAGWQLDDRLVPLPGEPRVFKHFSSSFAETNLAEVLDRLGVKQFVMCGAQTDFCIRNTWHHALALGYSPVLVGDAHTTFDTEWDGVPLPAKQIIAYTNFFAQNGGYYPDATGRLCNAAEIEFA